MYFTALLYRTSSSPKQQRVLEYTLFKFSSKTLKVLNFVYVKLIKYSWYQTFSKNIEICDVY